MVSDDGDAPIMTDRFGYSCPVCSAHTYLSANQKHRIHMGRIVCDECRSIFKASDHEIDNNYYGLNKHGKDKSGVLKRINDSTVAKYIHSKEHPFFTLLWTLLIVFFSLVVKHSI